MTSNDFKFEKVRDFGALFSDTFLFIKQNFKNLAKGLLYYVFPISLIQGVVLGLIQFNSLTNLSSGGNIFTQGSSFLIITTFISYFLMLLAYSFAMSFVMNYVNTYREKGANNFELSEVWKRMITNIPQVLGALFLCGLLSLVGFFILLIPGIYIAICVSLVIPIVIFEKETVGSAISSCFSLIKNNWWNTFGFLFIISIIGYSLNFFVQLPNFIYQMVVAIFMSTGDPITPSKALSILFSIIQALGYAFIQVLPITAIVIQYFNLIEKKQSPSLLKDLETVGTDE
ncbi:hypothetical protein GCQ56_05155 [Marinifilum sp. N1E240]|uniref:hypothetical protein n=1 Tax=Marinifilum sp. N1E240 TaxID=2608082 RepID=UPI00128DF945|nr:hypothetical protein [Marinifilum sp. N1E240]MPQ46391.1 hypothetical protein [Marinifilum sp. N1E240]